MLVLSGIEGGNCIARQQQAERPLVEDIHAVLNSDQTLYLLTSLCVKLGFCLPPKEQERIVYEAPLTVYDFADAVLMGEGIDPATADKDILYHVRRFVADAFAKYAPATEDEP